MIATLVAVPAHAQQTSPTPAPTRVPPPTLTTIPALIPERFSIATPTPTATSAPTPTPTPTPAATQAARTPVAAPTQRAPQAQPTSTVAAPAASPTPVAAPTVPPIQPQVIGTTVPTPVPAQPAPSQSPPWLWALAGAGATALAGLAGWFFLRRREPEVEEPVAEVAAPAAAPPPPVTGASPAPILPPPALAPTDPFEFSVQPQRIQITEREVLIDIELIVANTSGSGADAIRLSAVGISASQHQDAQIAGFQAASQLASSAPPFDLAAGTAGRMPVQISVPREQMHVVDVGGRPMFVPILAIDLRWRGGLSIRRFGASFMLGTAGQEGKVGPIWLDRGQPRGPLAASRYVARTTAAA